MNSTDPRPLQQFFVDYRKTILWLLVAALIIWLAFVVKEVSMLLLVGYALALLLDPLVDGLEKQGIPRSAGILGLGMLCILILTLCVLFAGPVLIEQLTNLLDTLPNYIKVWSAQLQSWVEGRFGYAAGQAAQRLSNEVRQYFMALNVDSFKTVGKTLWSTLAQGYSITLTLINLVLLPFFTYYIARDLDIFHARLLTLCRPDLRDRVRQVGKEVLTLIYAFVKGQLTVCAILAVMLSVGLAIVGLPWSVAVGVIAGLGNMVPYLGFAIGIVLASLITMVDHPGVWDLIQVWAVFGIVNAIEGSIITPKIVGESTGLHPLVVMLALIIGGQLFGLIGLIIAIPAAAAIRVLFSHMFQIVNEPSPVAVETP